MTVPITFVSSHARPGGSERYLLTLLAELGDGWIHDVVVLEEGPLVDELRSSGYPATVIASTGKQSSVALAALRLRSLLRRSPPAVVHANGVKAALVAAMAMVGLKIPLVWLKHDVSRDGAAARRIARRCARVIGVSEFVMKVFPEHGVDPRYMVVHTGQAAREVNRDLSRRKVLDELGAGEDAFVVGMIGRLDRFKGHGELIEAAPHVLEKHPEARFLLIGGPDDAHPGMERMLRETADRAGVSDAVHFAGHRDDAVELIAGFDLGVIPSIAAPTGMGREGFSLVGLEYLAVGVPVVAYRAGGLPELVGDCGLLVPEGDRAALAAAIVDLLDDPPRREQLADCGRKRLEARFKLDIWRDALQDVYTTVAS